MSYQVKICRAISEIGQGQWQMLKVPSCYLSYDWLQVVEARRSPDVYYYVAIVDEKERIIAAAPCYLASQPNIYTTYNVRDILAGTFAAGHVRKYLPSTQQQVHQKCALSIQKKLGLRLFPSLLCTARQGYASSPMFHRDLDTQTEYRVAHILVDAVTKLGQQLICPVTSFLYVERSNPVIAVLSDTDYIGMAMKAGTCLKLGWNDFNEYLQSLSKKRRKNVRWEMKKFRQSGLTINVQELAELPTKRLAVLLRNTQARYDHRVGPRTEGFEAYFEGLKRIPLPSRVYVARAGDKIVGFALFFQYRNALFARCVGFDYRLLGKDFCYFNLLFYQAIADALILGLSRIEYGTGSLETKLARGCSLLPMYGYFHIQDALDDSVLRTNATLVTQAQEQAYTALQERFSCDVL